MTVAAACFSEAAVFGRCTPIGAVSGFLAELRGASMLSVAAETTVVDVCRQLHEAGAWSCVVRLADGSLRLLDLSDLHVALLDSLRAGGSAMRALDSLGQSTAGDIAWRRLREPLAATTPLGSVVEMLAETPEDRLLLDVEGGDAVTFNCSDLLELLLQRGRGVCEGLQETAGEFLHDTLDQASAIAVGSGELVLHCLELLRFHSRATAAIVLDDAEEAASHCSAGARPERVLGLLSPTDVRLLFLVTPAVAARWLASPVQDFIASELRVHCTPRAGIGAAHYPFVHADAAQTTEALASRLVVSRSSCIAVLSASKSDVLGVVTARDIVCALRGRAAFNAESWFRGSHAMDSNVEPTACEEAAACLGRIGGRELRVRWVDESCPGESLAAVLHFESETEGASSKAAVLALEDAPELDPMACDNLIRLPRVLGSLPAEASGCEETSAVVLKLDPGKLAADAGQHRTLTRGRQRPWPLGVDVDVPGTWSSNSAASTAPPAAAATMLPLPSCVGGDHLQIVLYQQRDLVLYDWRQNRVFATELSEEQAGALTRSKNSICPLCRQRLNPAWAFVVEGYFEMIASTAPATPTAGAAPASATAAASTTAAAEAAAYVPQNIPMGLLNTGYYARFFAEERKLGSGSFGAVYLCRHVMDEIELGTFAVKKLALGDDTKRLRQVIREVKALERLRHMNVIDYKHSWLEMSRHSEFCPYVPFLFILMEYCNAGALEGLIWPNGFVRGATNNAAAATMLNEELIWMLFQDICCGLQHLHSRGILHRDLKPSNILLHLDEHPADGAANVPRAILSDFGTCEILGEVHSVASRVQGGYAIEFVAPECLMGQEWEEPADMWSAGLVLYAMCYGDLPYHSDLPERCRELVAAHTVLPTLPDFRSEDLRRLISALTARESVARPTAAEAERVCAAALRRNAAERGAGSAPGASAAARSSPTMRPSLPAPLELMDAPCVLDDLAQKGESSVALPPPALPQPPSVADAVPAASACSGNSHQMRRANSGSSLATASSAAQDSEAHSPV
eukprot:TRINITY_DN20778_c0_g1_i1.p1 TRINITY_DN20778_c0_g1~~TRINITY_DN20778_c0_g1_i1.p1  ORF type:complete len:1048 (-),score=202.32 TRINITY_DN20778_c0_g1_i1:121-3207(-)